MPQRLPTFISRRTRFVIFKAELVETSDRRSASFSRFSPGSVACHFVSTFSSPFFSPFILCPVFSHSCYSFGPLVDSPLPSAFVPINISPVLTQILSLLCPVVTRSLKLLSDRIKNRSLSRLPRQPFSTLFLFFFSHESRRQSFFAQFRPKCH